MYYTKSNERIRYFSLLKSYMNDRHFETKVDGEIPNRLPVLLGIPQGNILDPILFILYTANLPLTRDTTVGIFADHTIFAPTD